MSRTEQKIVTKAAAGDRMAFRELVLEHSDAMFRLAWRLTCDQSVADDIVQEAFIKAWRKLGNFRMQSSFRSWLHRITVNTAMGREKSCDGTGAPVAHLQLDLVPWLPLQGLGGNSPDRHPAFSSRGLASCP